MFDRRYHLLVPVVLMLVTSGCLGAVDGGTGGSSAGERVSDRAVEAMQDVESARSTVSMTVRFEDRELDMEADTVVDRDARRMRMDFSLSMPGRSITTEQYIVNDTQYINVDDQWRTRSIQIDVWGGESRLARQRELLEESEVELVENRTFEGSEVTVLRVEPDEETLKELIERQYGQQLGEDVTIEDVTYRQYVDTETYRLRKIEMNMSMQIRDEPASATMTMTIDEYNFDPTITLPEEARQAADR